MGTTLGVWVLLISAGLVHGEVITWTNGSSNQDYSNIQNWTPNKVPLPGDTVLIGLSTAPIGCADIPVLNGAVTVNSLKFAYSGDITEQW